MRHCVPLEKCWPDCVSFNVALSALFSPDPSSPPSFYDVPFRRRFPFHVQLSSRDAWSPPASGNGAFVHALPVTSSRLDRLGGARARGWPWSRDRRRRFSRRSLKKKGLTRAENCTRAYPRGTRGSIPRTCLRVGKRVETNDIVTLLNWGLKSRKLNRSKKSGASSGFNTTQFIIVISRF